MLERRSSCILVYLNFLKWPTEATDGPFGQLRGSAPKGRQPANNVTRSSFGGGEIKFGLRP